MANKIDEIRFIDLNTGNVFNGGYPYVFWFDGEQSTELIYTQPICFISNHNNTTVQVPESNVFKLLKLQSDNINSFENKSLDNVTYKDITELYSDISSGVQQINMNGYRYGSCYIYLFYISASAEIGGEYQECFKIYDKNNTLLGKYSVGADFYEENELHYINLSNLGIEIPDAIQKVLYPSNVHEDKKDNILLNRKWKELLSNYWDIIANKGSYKSLYNALKWFEYGDLIKLYEIWKHDDIHGVKYEEQDLQQILSNKYFETLNGFAKTTYIAISCALEKIAKSDGKVLYDSEKNPELEYITNKWSHFDLSLKLSLLGNFYKTYFLPIHINCIRSTIEDIVYSNTVKLISSSTNGRLDMHGNSPEIICNIKDNSIFPLTYTSCRVGRDTLFANLYTEKNTHSGEITNYDNIDIIGVQPDEPYFNIDLQNGEKIKDEDLKTYYSQRFNDIGSLIEFKMTLKSDCEDFVKREELSMLGDKTRKWTTITNRKIYRFEGDSKNGYTANIKFYILCTREQQYEIKLLFETAGGKIYTKIVKFNVIDTNNASIKLYKIVQNDKIKIGRTNPGINEYVFGRISKSGSKNWFKNPYKQYIPTILGNPREIKNENKEGVYLNNLLIIKKTPDRIDPSTDEYLTSHYFMWNVTRGKKDYVICLSKTFGFTPNSTKLAKYKAARAIYKNEYIFYPEFHHLKEITGDDISDYIVTDEDAVCVIPNITFGKFIEDAQWEFVNTSDLNDKSIIPPVDIKEPFVAESSKKLLDPGYYDIIFRYKLMDHKDYNTVILKSAFLKK